MKAFAAALVAALMLAGCSGSGDDSSSTSSQDVSSGTTGSSSTTGTRSTGPGTATSGTGPGTGGANRAPTTPTLQANVAQGEVPLVVNFTLDATDPDGDKLTWTLDADADGKADRQGTTLPATTNHTYTAKGVFNATLTVTDGKLSANKTVAITVTADAATPQEDYSFEGTVTGVWATEYVGDPSPHSFEVTQPMAKMTIAITEGQGAVDLDYYVNDPSGAEVAARNGIFPADNQGEPDTVIDAPAIGTWTVTVYAANAANGAYTLDVTFT